MSATSVTVSGTAQFSSGLPVPNAVVTCIYNETITNSASALVGKQVAAGADGTFSVAVSATDDSASVPTTGEATWTIHDPVTGQEIEKFTAPIPHASGTATFASLKALANQAT